jgi:hypothetical protein
LQLRYFLTDIFKGFLRPAGSGRATYIIIPYRAVKPIRRGYKNQWINAVQGNNRCLF